MAKEAEVAASKREKYQDSIEAVDIATEALREFLRFDIPTQEHRLEEVEKAQDDNGTQYWRVQISYRPTYDGQDLGMISRFCEKIYKDVLIKADDMTVTAIKSVEK